MVAKQYYRNYKVDNKKIPVESIVQSFPFPFFIVDIDDYRITMLNNACREYVHDDNILYCYSTLHKKDNPCHIEITKNICPIEEIKKTKKPVIVEHCLYDKNGKKRQYRVHAYPVFDDEENLTYIIEYLEEITNLKKTKDLLVKSEYEKKVILESIKEGIIYYNADLKIKWSNKAAADFTSFKKEELIGISWHEVFKNINDSYTNIPVITAFQTGKIQELEIKKPNGQVRIIKAYPVKKNNNKIIGVVETFIDITSQKKLENEKNIIQAQFIQAQKMEAVGRLAGGVAHDFNNILTTIIGLTDILTINTDIDKEIREDILEIRKSANRGSSLTRQLLTFSRRKVLKTKSININELIINMEKMIRRLIGEDVQLELNLNPEIAFIKADKGQIEQIIMNLVVNSRDAMPHGGKILLETQNFYADDTYCRIHNGVKPGDYVLITVTDNGIGMNEETREKAFEPFYTTKGEGKGTGLGLSTVYGAVKQSKGFIDVYSEEGRGTTIRIYIPKAQSNSIQYDQVQRLATIETGSESILVVEDDNTLRKMIKLMLKKLGYTIFEASSGIEALEMIEKGKSKGIDLLLTDVIMPKLNGSELAEKVKRINPGIKILFTSGYTNNAIEHHGILNNSRFFISKPFSLRDLADKVHEVLEAG